MKLLYLTETYGGTTETFISDLINGFVNEVDELVVAVDRINQVPSNASFKLIKVPFHQHRLRRLDSVLNIGQGRSLTVCNRIADSLAMPAIRGLLDREQPDSVFIDFGQNTLPIWKLLRERSIPYVLHVHAVDITSFLANAHYRRSLHEVFQDAIALIAPSDHVRRLLILEGAPPAKCHKVQLGISVGIDPLPWNERLEGDPRLCYLGRFVGKKHPLALVEMMRLISRESPKTRLVAIGSGDHVEDFKRRISRYSLEENITHFEAMPKARAMEHLNKSWIYVQHSVTDRRGDQEGWPVVIGEAGLLGLPVVATRHSGIPEQIVDGQNGYLVPEHDFEMMAERVLDLVKNPESMKAMGERSRRWVSRYTSEARAKKLIDFFGHVSSKSSKA